MPCIPTGCSDYDSPVSHSNSYNSIGEKSGIFLASNVMRTTNTLNSNRQKYRDMYEKWIEDQLGLHSTSRCQRKSRGCRDKVA
jgi:hypothetical protein